MHRTKGMIIIIMGIDGSGKTTLARRIEESVDLENLQIRYVYAKYIPILTRPIIYLGALILGKEKMQNKTISMVNSKKKRAFMRKRAISTLTQMLIASDYLIQLIPKIWIPYFRKRTLLCDRYIHDTVLTDIGPDLGWEGDVLMNKIQMFQRFAPRPDLVLFLSVRPEVAWSRKRDVPSIAYLEERSLLYERVANRIGALTIDANQESPRVYLEAIDAIKRLDGRSR